MGTQEDLHEYTHKALQEALVLEGELRQELTQLRQTRADFEWLLEAFQNVLAYTLGQVSQVGIEKDLKTLLAELEREQKQKQRRMKRCA